ncbi:MAG: hypothetical protein HUU10_05420 [Bacteroidetes bacterium]|nr:hypothetical protein [Bacteroidota bacterium]
MKHSGFTSVTACLMLVILTFTNTSAFIAIHLCGGSVTDIAVNQHTQGCGMDREAESCGAGLIADPGCCQESTIVLTSTTDAAPVSSFHPVLIVPDGLSLSVVPATGFGPSVQTLVSHPPGHAPPIYLLNVQLITYS